MDFVIKLKIYKCYQIMGNLVLIFKHRKSSLKKQKFPFWIAFRLNFYLKLPMIMGKNPSVWHRLV